MKIESAVESATETETEPCSSDRTQLELLRGGRASCAPVSATAPTVSVVVIAMSPRSATGAALRSAFAQSSGVHQIVVVGPKWSDAPRATWQAASAGDPRLLLLPVPRPGLAPAAPCPRRFVRAAHYLRAALPFVTGDWITVCGEEAELAPDFVSALLSRALKEALELVWGSEEAPLADRAFGGTLWAAPLAALVPRDNAGWSGTPTDAAWWARLVGAGVRVPGAGAVR
jgi:hypothetical protein